MIRIRTEDLDIEAPNKKFIVGIIDSIHPQKTPYVIIENERGSYIQAAGSLDRITIEVRIYDEMGGFKHFVIGKGEIEKEWTLIECGVGPINVMRNEVLNGEDAQKLFSYFFDIGEVEGSYYKRNVTENFDNV